MQVDDFTCIFVFEMEKSKTVKILMVDDHPSMLEGYKTILGYNSQGFEIKTKSAHTCESAYEIITDIELKNYFEVAFLDYSLPIYEEKNINNGEDLAELIKKYSPKTKFLVVTMRYEEEFTKFDKAKHENLGDFVILTDSKVPRSQR